MAAIAPAAVTVRMYNVGFGDCFLLTFEYAQGARHMLVDFGSTAAPRSGAKKTDYMERVAQDIKAACAGKLDVLVATHRHREHISGFGTDVATVRIIADLRPDHVIQPWTEDPRAAKAEPGKMTAQFLGALQDMHAVAAAIKQFAADETLAGKQTREQLQLIGDGNRGSPSAVESLQKMGRKGQAHYVNAGMELKILPGVKCTVLGPPTLQQADTVRKERVRDPVNFRQFRSFWGSQSLAMRRTLPRVPGTARAKQARNAGLPPNVRWFVKQSRQIRATQLLSLVRDLDTVMSNTSVILLLEVGKRKILLPGDAQIENWSYALSQPEWRDLLAEVDLYKVGHHGSLNATPKPLWALFKNKGGPSTRNRLETLCSTRAGRYGSVASGTEVPRRVLVQEVERESRFTSSEGAKDTFYNEVTLEC
jgi:beta-lactamase superfamily II metal-dependent hydrolase